MQNIKRDVVKKEEPILCPVCKKEPAWVVWGKATPCGTCQPIKITAGLDEGGKRWIK